MLQVYQHEFTYVPYPHNTFSNTPYYTPFPSPIKQNISSINQSPSIQPTTATVLTFPPSPPLARCSKMTSKLSLKCSRVSPDTVLRQKKHRHHQRQVPKMCTAEDFVLSCDKSQATRYQSLFFFLLFFWGGEGAEETETQANKKKCAHLRTSR